MLTDISHILPFPAFVVLAVLTLVVIAATVERNSK